MINRYDIRQRMILTNCELYELNHYVNFNNHDKDYKSSNIQKYYY